MFSYARDRGYLEGVWVDIFVFAISIFALTEAVGFQLTSRYLPIAASLGCLVLSGVHIFLRFVHARRDGQIDTDSEDGGAEARDAAISRRARAVAAGTLSEDVALLDATRLRRYGLWFIGYLAAASLLGFIVSSAAFVGLFLKLEARSSMPMVIASSVVVAGIVLLGGQAFTILWPRGILDPLGTLFGI